MFDIPCFIRFRRDGIDNSFHTYRLTAFLGEGSSGCVYQAERLDSVGLYTVKIYHNHMDIPSEADIVTVWKRIVDTHIAHGSNEFMHNIEIGTCVPISADEEASAPPYTGEELQCQIFFGVVGAKINPVKWTVGAKNEKQNEALLKNALEAYKDCLTALSFIHEAGILHWDINPSNIYSFSVNESERKHNQFIDLDSAVEVSDILSGKHNIYSCATTGVWYTGREKTAYANLIENGETDLVYVLDNTAIARVLLFMLTGTTRSERIETLCKKFSMAVSTALSDFFAKSLYTTCDSDGHMDAEASLRGRYTSVCDMLVDISDILDVLSDDPHTVTAMNLILLNRWEEDRQADLALGQDIRIDPQLLPSLRTFDRNEESDSSSWREYSSLNQLLKENIRHILLLGDGGQGKTSSLKYEYYCALTKQRKEARCVYVPLRLFKATDTVTTNDIRQYIDKTVGTPIRFPSDDTPVTVFLDGYDEIPYKSQSFENSFFRSLNALSESDNERFIISSRYEPACLTAPLPGEGAMPVFVLAQALPLTESVIRLYLESAFGAETPFITSENVLTLLSSPMMLVLFVGIKWESNASWSDLNESRLIRCYLRQMFGNKNGEDRNRPNERDREAEELFDDCFSDLSRMVFHEEMMTRKERKYQFDVISRYFNTIVRFEKVEGTTYYSLHFQSELYRDFFRAVACARLLSQWGKALLEGDVSAVKEACDSLFAQTHPRSADWASLSHTYMFLLMTGQELDLNKPQHRAELEAVCGNLSTQAQDNQFGAILYRIVSLFFNTATYTFNYHGCLTRFSTDGWKDCTILKALKVPASVVTLEHNCLSSLPALRVVAFDRDSQLINIEDWAFANCPSLQSVDLSNCYLLTDIGQAVFWKCESLSSTVALDNTPLRNIGDWAFYGCHSLSMVILQNGGNIQIASHAFWGTSELLHIISLPEKNDLSESFLCGQYECPDAIAQGLSRFGENFMSDPTCKNAEEPLTEALALFRPLAEKDVRFKPPLARVTCNLAVVYKNTNRLTESEENFKAALEMYRELEAINSDTEVNTAKTCLNFASLLHTLNRFAQAAAVNQEAIEKFRSASKRHPEYRPYVYKVAYNTADLYTRMGRYEEAEALFEDALQTCMELEKENPSSTDSALIAHGYANMCRDSGQYEKAGHLYAKALQVYAPLRDQSVDGRRGYTFASNDYAGLLLMIGKVEEALHQINETLLYCRMLVDDNCEIFLPFYAKILHCAAEVNIAAKSWDVAEKMAKESDDLFHKMATDSPEAWAPFFAMNLISFGTIYMNSKEYGKSEKAFLEALDIYHRLGENEPEGYTALIATASKGLYELYMDMGNTTEAQKYRASFESTDKMNLYATQ